MSNPLPLLHFVTSNPHKAAEVGHLLGSSVRRLDLDLPEIQAATIEAIAQAKLEAARPHAPHPFAVEDVSLDLEGLGGFPGPYIKWLITSAGGEGLAAIVKGLHSNLATARCVVAVWDGRVVRMAEGAVEGEIVSLPRGSRDFGWDAWFVPEGSSRTYGEMSREEKREVSHRAIAWRRMRQILEES